MNDMTAVIVPKSDQINADDLIAGPMSVTISGVAITAGTEQPVSIDIGLPGKVYRPCKSMSRVLVAAWGPDAKAYVGRSLTLYRDPTVKWGGMDVGGIRISHISHIEKPMTMALTATRATRKPYTVSPLKGAPAAQEPRQTPARAAQASSDPTSEVEAWAAKIEAKLAEYDTPHKWAQFDAWWHAPAQKAKRDAAAGIDAARVAEVGEAYEAARGRFVSEGVE